MTAAASVSGYSSCAKSRGRTVVRSRCVPKGERPASACVCRATDERCSPPSGTSGIEAAEDEACATRTAGKYDLFEQRLIGPLSSIRIFFSYRDRQDGKLRSAWHYRCTPANKPIP